MRIRLVCSQGSQILEINNDLTFAQLNFAISNAVGALFDVVSISFGYPPKTLNLSDSDSISGLITENEVLRLETVSISSSSRKTVTKTSRSKTESTPKRSTSKPTTTTVVSVSSEEDLFSKLSSALGGGRFGGRSSSSTSRSTTQESTAFRSLFSTALSQRYDEAKAEARCAAIHANNYKLVISNTDNTARMITVEFWMGLSARMDSMFSEQVPVLSRTEVAQLIGILYNDGDSRLLLKEYEMSKFSPRTFWNVVHHCGPDVHTGLAALCPSLDWSFLSSRKRKKSQKAIENEVTQAVLNRRFLATFSGKATTHDDDDDVQEIHDDEEDDIGYRYSDSSNRQQVDELLIKFPLSALHLRSQTNLSQVVGIDTSVTSSQDLVNVVLAAREMMSSMIMLAVCDEQQQDVDELAGIRLARPRLLGLWRDREERLLSHLQKGLQGDRIDYWSLKRLQLITARCQCVLKQFGWLE